MLCQNEKDLNISMLIKYEFQEEWENMHRKLVG